MLRQFQLASLFEIWTKTLKLKVDVGATEELCVNFDLKKRGSSHATILHLASFIAFSSHELFWTVVL